MFEFEFGFGGMGIIGDIVELIEEEEIGGM